MPERYLRRSSALDAGVSQKFNANSVRVDSGSNLLKFGTGSSGVVEKTVQTLDGIAPVSLTGSASLTAAAHAGQLLVLNAAAGATLTLPAATGSGAIYRIFVGTALTSGSLVLQVASASDYFRGFAYVKTDDTAVSANTYATANTGTLATESDTLTWNRTTTGTAVIGDFIEVIDLATGVWAIETENNASGSEATPFSAAV